MGAWLNARGSSALSAGVVASVVAVAVVIAGCGTRSSLNPRGGSPGSLPSDAAIADASFDGLSRLDTLPDICKAWRCWQEAGRTFCGNPKSPGLPGVGYWSCELLIPPRRTIPTWRCDGDVPKGGLVETVVPCSAPWQCQKIGESALHDLYRCEKPDDDLDRPPDALMAGRHAICVKGTTWGTLCELTTKPAPENPWSPENMTAPCRPGAVMWCPTETGQGSSRWGQITCANDGRWPAQRQNPLRLDCRRLADGRGPDTLCTCYFRVNPLHDCCERRDCLVPPRGEKGRRCDPTPGELCDTCDPQASECGAGAACVITAEGEGYCTRPCLGGACPSDFSCRKLQDLVTRQCMPVDLSCYF